MRAEPCRGNSVTVNGVTELLSAIRLGVTEQYIPGGAPMQVRSTAVGNSPLTAMVTSATAGAPEKNDRLFLPGRFRDREKSIPAPESEITCGLPAALSVNWIEPMLVPTDVGEKVTFTVQFCIEARDEPQVFVCENAEEDDATLLMDMAALPRLVYRD
jgi:hypothetical protein